MPVDLSALVSEKTTTFPLSDTEERVTTVGSKRTLMRSVLENRFPEYLNTPIPVSFSRYNLKERGLRGTYEQDSASLSGRITTEPITGYDVRTVNPKTGDITSSAASFTSEDFNDQLGVTLHELFHARAGRISENQFLKDAQTAGVDPKLILKWAKKGQFLSSDSGKLSEFVANAVPLRDMQRKGFVPAGRSWEDQAVILKAMEENIPGFSKFLDMQQSPETKPDLGVLDRILMNTKK